MEGQRQPDSVDTAVCIALKGMYKVLKGSHNKTLLISWSEVSAACQAQDSQFCQWAMLLTHGLSTGFKTAWLTANWSFCQILMELPLGWQTLGCPN